MAYLAIAYPELSTKSYEEIQKFRSDHDKLFFELIDPHFTFIFSVTDVLQTEFFQEVKTKSLGFTKFIFNARHAILHKDELSEYHYVFLIPDEKDQFIKLHDSLYSGKLSDHLRHDIKYVPHITIGNAKERSYCQKMVEEWNKKDLTIQGTISQLTIIGFESGIVTNLEEIELQLK